MDSVNLDKIILDLKMNKSEELLLNWSNLNSKSIEQLSNVLRDNSSVQKISLFGNKIEAAGAKSLAEVLKKNSTIKCLQIDGTDIGPEGSTAIFHSLKFNQSLESLECSNNSITNEGLISFASMLLLNYVLTTVQLENNNIDDGGILILSEALKVNQSLSRINLSRNNISEKGAHLLAEALESNFTLLKLDLKQNLIENTSILDEINKKLKENSCHFIEYVNSNFNWNIIINMKSELKVLILKSCELNEIPNEVNELLHLQILDLQDNLLTSFPDVSKLNKLITLNLARNKIDLNSEGENFFKFSPLVLPKLPPTLEHLILVGNLGYSKKIQDIVQSSAFYIILNGQLLKPELSSLNRNFSWLSQNISKKLSFDKVLETTKYLKELQVMDLRSTGLYSFPNEMSQFDKLCTQIVLMDNQFKKFPESLTSFTKLKILRMQMNSLTTIPESVSNIKSLYEISLEDNQFEEFPFNLTNIKSLERIWLDRNSISDIQINSVNKFFNLERISLCQNKLNNFAGIVEWTSLEVLLLNENKIEFIPKDIANLKKLRKLHLNKNKIKFIPFEIGELKALKDIQIKDNLIEEIPTVIGELTKLEFMNVSNNLIKVLPPSMSLLTNLKNLNVKGNPIISPPIEFTNSLNDLNGYWKDLLGGEEKCNYLKLVIVGEENVGKTTLVRTLTSYINSSTLFKRVTVEREFNNKPLSTDGIEISVHPIIIPIDKFHGLPNNQLILNIWDFGGQQVYYSTHVFFLSPNSLYLIVWDMSKKDEELRRLLYWIQTIQCFIKNPMIILVGTHLDALDEKYVDEILKNVSSKTGIPREFILGVSCKNGKNYDKLIQIIKNYVVNDEEYRNGIILPSNNNSQSLVGQPFPKSYFDLKKIIDEENTHRTEHNLPPISEWDQFKLISQKLYILHEDELKRALSFLHCLGFCLYFPKDKELNRYIILNSQWLADTMATLITTKGSFIQKGILDHQLLKQLWREPTYPAAVHPILFELLEKFKVVIPITETKKTDLYSGKSVIPSLLSEELAPLVVLHWHQGKDIELHRIFQFSFLPTQIFPQFMASIFSLIGHSGVKYWRDGILVVKETHTCLIELDPLNQRISVSIAGTYYLPLLKKVQLTLENVIRKWENISADIFLTCPSCIPLSGSKNKCFKLKECYDFYQNYSNYVFCNNAWKGGRQTKIALKKLIPELDTPNIKKVNWHEIELSSKLDENNLSETYKASWQEDFVTIKKLKSDFTVLPDIEIFNETSMKEFFHELQFFARGNHPNLLQILGIVFSPPAIIFPFAAYKNLFEVIHIDKSSELSSFKLTLRILLDISFGLNYLHSLDPPLVHSNLKSENIFVMSMDYKSKMSVCKIGDFGISQFSVGKFLIHKSIYPAWTAPEVLQGTAPTIHSDVYSFGMVLYEILTKQLPYSIDQNPDWKFTHNVEKAILEGIKPIFSKQTIEKKFKTKIPDQLYDIMELCWTDDPKNRPNCSAIAKIIHPLLLNYWEAMKEVSLLKLENNLED